MEAYLKTQELWEYVDLSTEKPEAIAEPATPSSKATEDEAATYVIMKKHMMTGVTRSKIGIELMIKL